MKPGKLLFYALSGVIVGLLIENCALRVSEKAGKKVRRIKKNAREKIPHFMSHH